MTWQSPRWLNQGCMWWRKRTLREQTILLTGSIVLIAAVLWLGGNALWHFYLRLPEEKLNAVLRQRLIEDVTNNNSSQSTSTVPPHSKMAIKTGNSKGFLSEASQAGVNGTCTPQGEHTWLCTGKSASLESVQHWWMKGRFEGFYVEHFEAKAESPGRVRWTLTAKRP